MSTLPPLGPGGPVPPDERPRPAVRRRLGEILVELGLTTPGEVAAALEVQQELGGAIGEILVERGKITRLDLASALAAQWEAWDHAPPDGAGTDEPDADGRVVLEKLLRSFEGTATRLRDGLDRLEAVRAADAAATESRFVAVEAAIARLSRAQTDLDLDVVPRLELRVSDLATVQATASRQAHAAVDDAERRLRADVTALAAEIATLRNRVTDIEAAPAAVYPAVDAGPKPKGKRRRSGKKKEGR